MGNIEVLYNGDSKISVRVDRTIRLGHTIRINPSEAWLGIDSGLIQVTHILSRSDMQSIDGPDHELAKYAHQIEADKDVYLQGSEGNDYASALYDLDNQPWIVYGYNDNKGEWFVLPLDVFVPHTMMY